MCTFVHKVKTDMPKTPTKNPNRHFWIGAKNPNKNSRQKSFVNAVNKTIDKNPLTPKTFHYQKSINMVNKNLL